MVNVIQDSNRKSEEIKRLVAKVNDLEKSEADVTSLSKEVAELKEQIGDVEKSLAAARKNVFEEGVTILQRHDCCACGTKLFRTEGCCHGEIFSNSPYIQ